MRSRLAMRLLLLVVAGLGVALGGLLVMDSDAREVGITALLNRPRRSVIARAWHGKTPREKADSYEQYLSDAIKKFPTIKGNLGYQMMRIEGGPDGEQYVEFQVISYWESLDAIKAYAGQDIRRTRDLPRDKEFLVDMEPYVRNYELRVHAIRP